MGSPDKDRSAAQQDEPAIERTLDHQIHDRQCRPNSPPASASLLLPNYLSSREALDSSEPHIGTARHKEQRSGTPPGKQGTHSRAAVVVRRNHLLFAYSTDTSTIPT